MPSLSICCPSMGNHEEAVTSWRDTMSKPWPIRVDDSYDGFLTKCDKAWRETDATVIGYLHSDLYILEHRWDERILAQFNNPDVVVVGVVGAETLAHEDIYKIPYDYRQLARGRVFSNLVDAEAHGATHAGVKKVAVIDSCAVFVRRSFLSRLAGWPVRSYPNSSHCSDLWLCCMAHRYRLSTVMVGITALHRSGGKGARGIEWLEKNFGRDGDKAAHRLAHQLIYDEFRDVLPIGV